MGGGHAHVVVEAVHRFARERFTHDFAAEVPHLAVVGPSVDLHDLDTRCLCAALALVEDRLLVR